ncbi:MAG: hypothetical protein DMG79_18490 [Acidobacteria bacterium]|nr:MAG: hypothetical protein DMG79_18490 [Acidobacteriota bacterium]
MTRANRRVVGILGVVLIAMATIFAANAGRWLVLDAPARSDVILVLAGETDRRPERALQLLDQGYGHSIVMNVPAAAMIYDIPQIQLAEQYIQRVPEKAAIKICPIMGLSTREESQDVARCLAGEEGQRILIVTSEFHTRRALSIFRHELPSKSFSVAVAHDDTQFGMRWWAHRQWAKTCMDEWIRLLWWTAVERWR